jgi:hypothetical protein
MTLNFQRSLPIQANVERFVRPSHVEDGHLVGHVWSTDLGREVLVRAFVPKSWDADQVIEAAAAGALVLDRSLLRLTRAGGVI